MELKITGHGLDVTPALKSYIKETFDRLERHFDKIIAANAVLNVENLSQIAEATLFVPKGELHARSESEDMYAAIDTLKDKLDRQLKKHKEKTQAHRE